MRMTAAIGAGLVMACGAMAQAGELRIGDTAPEIDIAHWVKGEPIDGFKDGKVYVVEFWATWCSPCVASMPHLSELQERYSDDVQIIGVSDEDLPTVVGFLFEKNRSDHKMNNDRARYTLATDPDKSVYDAYMTASGQRGIPTAFIVGRTGDLEWIGHPMGMDGPLAEIIQNTWDRDAYIAEQKKSEQLREKFADAMQREDWDTAIKVLDEVLEMQPDSFGAGKTRMMLIARHRSAEALHAEFERLTKQHWDDAQLLNDLAWTMVTDPTIQERDWSGALHAAERACELTDHKDAAILDTLAAAYYGKGDVSKAIKWQTKAVELAPPGDMHDELAERLAEYKKNAG